jgi:hypothetical protein
MLLKDIMQRKDPENNLPTFSPLKIGGIEHAQVYSLIPGYLMLLWFFEITFSVQELIIV